MPTQIWEERPLAHELQEYAACDVRYLHALADAINKKLPREVVGMVSCQIKPDQIWCSLLFWMCASVSWPELFR
jgi:hypothetical protein